MMEKLKVAFFTDMLVREHDGCMRTIFHILDRKPEDIEIRYFTGSDVADDKATKATPVLSITIPFNRSYKFAIPYLNMKSLQDSLDEFAPDVIHIASPSALGDYATRYANKKAIPVSAIYHTHYPAYVEYYLKDVKGVLPFIQGAVNRSLRKLYNQCDIILVPTQDIRTDLTELGIKPCKLHIWERGIDRTIFYPRQKETSIIPDIVQNEKVNILFASRLVWEKNLQTLIHIYDYCCAHNKGFNFIIAGSGSAEQELKSRMPSAHFLGSLSQDKLAQVYSDCDIFLFPSESETYGNVVVEAMSCGLPIICADGGGPKSFVKHDVNGLKVSPFDTKAYVAAIDKIVENDSLRDQLIENGLSHAQSNNWEVLVKRYYDILRTISGNHVINVDNQGPNKAA